MRKKGISLKKIFRFFLYLCFSLFIIFLVFYLINRLNILGFSDSTAKLKNTLAHKYDEYILSLPTDKKVINPYQNTPSPEYYTNEMQQFAESLEVLLSNVETSIGKVRMPDNPWENEFSEVAAVFSKSRIKTVQWLASMLPPDNKEIRKLFSSRHDVVPKFNSSWFEFSDIAAKSFLCYAALLVSKNQYDEAEKYINRAVILALVMEFGVAGFTPSLNTIHGARLLLRIGRFVSDYFKTVGIPDPELRKVFLDSINLQSDLCLTYDEFREQYRKGAKVQIRNFEGMLGIHVKLLELRSRVSAEQVFEEAFIYTNHNTWLYGSESERESMVKNLEDSVARNGIVKIIFGKHFLYAYTLLQKTRILQNILKSALTGQVQADPFERGTKIRTACKKERFVFYSRAYGKPKFDDKVTYLEFYPSLRKDKEHGQEPLFTISRETKEHRQKTMLAKTLNSTCFDEKFEFLCKPRISIIAVKNHQEVNEQEIEYSDEFPFFLKDKADHIVDQKVNTLIYGILMEHAWKENLESLSCKVQGDVHYIRLEN